MVADVRAEGVAETIADGASTGEHGDGTASVLPVGAARQIRTGASGSGAI